jgi:hypothetical protein
LWYEVIFKDPLPVSFLDSVEDFISAFELLLFYILVYILLYETIERDDIRIKRGDESDIGKSDSADVIREL